jgi:SAM-dependent methyltransferase
MSSQTLQDFWDASHTKINKEKMPSSFAVESEQSFPPNSLILDIGGGIGTDAIYFIQKGHQVILLDISKEALSFAETNASNHNVKFEKTIPLQIGENLIPLDKESIDIIYSRLALHYFNAEDTSNIFSDLYSLLKKDGHAYIAVKSPEDEPEMEYLKESATELEAGVYDDEGMTKSRFSKDQWEDILSKAGIKHYVIDEIKEKIDEKNDTTKSGLSVLQLTQIQFTK